MKVVHFSALRDPYLKRNIYVLRMESQYILVATDLRTRFDGDSLTAPELEPPRSFITLREATRQAIAMCDHLTRQGWTISVGN